MNIVVVGLGSMGRRRMRLTRELFPDCGLFGVDAREDRRAEALLEGAEKCFASIDEVNQDIDSALVCTPPLSHSSVIEGCLRRGWNVFTELNLVSDGYTENIERAKAAGRTLFLSSTFLYREETSYITNMASENPGTYRYHVGQYLPDWHPWESYKDYFVANSRTNGVRELLAIELPWLIRAYGNVVDVKAERSRQSGLDLPYNDTISALLRHEGGTVGNLTVDVVSRHPVRLFEFMSRDRYLTWDGTPDGLLKYNFETKMMDVVDLYSAEGAVRRGDYASFVVENAYKSELKCFFECAAGGAESSYSFEDDMKTLALVDEIEGTQ